MIFGVLDDDDLINFAGVFFKDRLDVFFCWKLSILAPTPKSTGVYVCECMKIHINSQENVSRSTWTIYASVSSELIRKKQQTTIEQSDKF